MPVRKMPSPIRSLQFDELKNALVAEWKSPDEMAAEPVIVEEGGGDYSPLHLYVVWTRWDGIDSRIRSEIIMDAFEEIFGLEKTLKVTVAMGLTPVEADRMGIPSK